jgi:predicted small lipoprotein YifL
MTLRRSLVVLVALASLAGCGGSSGGSAAPPSPSPTVDTVAADKAAITTAWEGFFTAGGPVDGHIALLEDGAKFRAELTASAKDPSNANLVAKVTDVVVSGTTATVTYDLTGKGGIVLLGGSIGEAVKIGAKWLVSKKTYCQLIQLQDSTVAHPGCS